jgi:hypothetical protein
VGGFEVSVQGKNLTLADKARPLFMALRSGDAFTVAALCEIVKADVDEGSVRTFLLALVNEGVLAILDD